MKYLEIADFQQVTSMLQGLDCGDVAVDGRMELYSCKISGNDKELYASMNEEYTLRASSPDAGALLSSSPFGPLKEPQSRRSFIHLIATLNASFPDYDFRETTCEEFVKESNLHMVINSINTILASAIPTFNVEMQPKMWSALDHEMKMNECNVYSFRPNQESDPFASDGSLWSFAYLFFNPKLKRVAFLCANAISKTAVARNSNGGPMYLHDDGISLAVSAERADPDEYDLDFDMDM
eukprot:TRINITY_DN6546_c0_g1_i1.p2 TRINITY_DN6546_c0_g1~~TRINITY_DN6546_c0_g1_i1.p2  ORF type:complete len:238 (-),score=66.33 TRINITY_DN6546_c0_g1_i1:1170-1883(-)